MVQSNTTHYHIDDLTHHLHTIDLSPEISRPQLTRASGSLCYFTYIPSAPSDHWSLETPQPSPELRAHTAVTADPQNPFLAARIPLLSPSQSMGAEKLLQLQTAAAHPQRPRPQPHQDVLELSDDSMSSTSSRSSSDSSSTSSRPKVCSRCQTTFGEFVAYSLNGYYCKRCAKITGYGG